VSETDDPRVFFAAERTLLAWVRTGLTVMGLGFVVARFGLFLRLLRHDVDVRSHFGSTVIGVGLVVLGSVAIALAARQHVRFCRTLGPGARPKPDLGVWSTWFAMVLSLVGIVLAGYMAMGSVQR
jgi:putative membrane protein